MKRLYTFLFLNALAYGVSAQNCQNYIVLNSDGSGTRIQAGDSNLVKHASAKGKADMPVIIRMQNVADKKNKQLVRISAYREDMRCVDKYARIFLDFDDYTDFEYGNESDDECCDGLFVMNSPGYLMAANNEGGKLRDCLKDKLISSIKITCKDGIISTKVSPEQSNMIRETFRCLLDE
jgi:hypothetical protein